MTWLVATWIATVDVKADMTGAETKLRRKPEKKGTGLESVTQLINHRLRKLGVRCGDLGVSTDMGHT